MLEDAADELGIFDAGDDSQLAAAALTGFDVDAKGALQALHPAHGVVFRGARLRADAAAAAAGRGDRRAQARRRAWGAKSP